MQIRAADNPLIRQIAELHDAAGRRAANAFLIEGRRAIDGLMQAGWAPLRLLVCEGLEIPAHWPEPIVIGERAAARASAARTPSGYLAVFAIPEPAPLDRAAGGLVLAGIADPGNLGTLLRTAAAFGVRQVVCAGGADPFGSKAVQSSAGAIAAVQLHRNPDAAMLSGGAPLCALVPRGGHPPEACPAGPRWLVVGGEADGIPSDWLASCSQHLTLPMPGAAVESLNAAIAGAVAMYALMMAGRPAS
jgi:RNA methyltransferase, TrmH family